MSGVTVTVGCTNHVLFLVIKNVKGRQNIVIVHHCFHKQNQTKGTRISFKFDWNEPFRDSCHNILAHFVVFLFPGQLFVCLEELFKHIQVTRDSAKVCLSGGIMCVPTRQEQISTKKIINCDSTNMSGTSKTSWKMQLNETSFVVKMFEIYI